MRRANVYRLRDICDCLGYDITLVTLIYDNFFNDTGPFNFNPFIYAYDDLVSFNPYDYVGPSGSGEFV